MALLVDDDTEKIPAKLNMSSWKTFYTSVLGETNAYSKVEETQAVLLAQVEAAKAKRSRQLSAMNSGQHSRL